MSVRYPFQKALITGAGRGIGAALCRELAGRSVQLIAMNRSRQPLDDLVKDIGEDAVTPYFADVTEFENLETCLREILQQHPDIDLVVLNAGLDIPQRIENFDWRLARDQIDTNLTSNYVFASAVIPHFLSRGRGRMAVVSSLGSYAGCPFEHAYNASKAGARMMVDGLRAELVESAVGITGIYPGFIGTDMIKGNAFDVPNAMPVEEAAYIIAEGMAEEKEEIMFPEETASMVAQVRNLPVAERIAAVRSLMQENP